MLENIVLGWIFFGDKFFVVFFVVCFVLFLDNGFCEIKFWISFDGSIEGFVEWDEFVDRILCGVEVVVFCIVCVVCIFEVEKFVKEVLFFNFGLI